MELHLTFPLVLELAELLGGMHLAFRLGRLVGFPEGSGPGSCTVIAPSA